MDVAQLSWLNESRWAKNWIMHGVEDSELPRLHEDAGLPFVRDLIEVAAHQCDGPDDIISLSNSDVGCIHGVTTYILDRVRAKGCSFAHRYDVEGRRLESPIQSEADVRNLRWYPGSDWFWMSKSWWDAHRAEVPDLVIGREFWDAVLRQVMKKSGGVGIPLAIWHEKHPSDWEKSGNRENLPGNKHNRALATKWFAENHSDANDPYRNTWNIVPGVTMRIDPLNGSALDRTRPTIVLPHRLEFHQNPVRKIPR